MNWAFETATALKRNRLPFYKDRFEEFHRLPQANSHVLDNWCEKTLPPAAGNQFWSDAPWSSEEGMITFGTD